MESVVCRNVFAPSCPLLAHPPQTNCPLLLYHKNKQTSERAPCTLKQQTKMISQQADTTGSGDTPYLCSAPNWLFICCTSVQHKIDCVGENGLTLHVHTILDTFIQLAEKTTQQTARSLRYKVTTAFQKYKIAFQDLFVSKTQRIL